MTIQQEAATLINELPDDSVKVLVELIKKMMPISRVYVSSSGKRKLGIAQGQFDIPDSIDDCNEEIANMFGV